MNESKEPLKGQVRLRDTRAFWELHPVAAAGIPFPLGTREYFEYYDGLREVNEKLNFSYALHEYRNFSGKNVLDVGCGNGYVLSKYAGAGAHVFGIDLTRQGIDLSRQRFSYLGLQGEFHIANAEELPYEDQSFDCVCSMGVLHHVPDISKAIKEIFRVLKPGGRLIMMVYHRNSLEYRLLFPLNRFRKGKSITQLVNEVDGIGNPRGEVYSRSELRDLLSAFQGLEMFAGLLGGLTGIRFLPKLGRATGLERQLGWFLYAKGIKPYSVTERIK
jgi:SAM-dependent methyltransferase